MTNQQLIEKYGQPRDMNNLEYVKLPYPKYLDYKRTVKVTRLLIHKDHAKNYLNSEIEVLKVYGPDKIKELNLDITGGTMRYDTLYKRGSKNEFTEHVFGIAEDIDPANNTMKITWEQSRMSNPEYKPYIDIKESWGFYSLGKYANFDSMHFSTIKH